SSDLDIRYHSYARRVIHKNGKATGIMFVDTRTGEEYEQPADVVALGAFSFANNRLLLLSEIGKPYNPETRKGVIGRNFNGQFNITFLGARGFFDDKKFNLYMGAGALGGTMSVFAGDNYDMSDFVFIIWGD